MPKNADLTGMVFGELTVLSREESRGGRTRWMCRCSCGNAKIVTAHELKTGKTKSCGASSHKVGRNIVDITGRRFGRLTALYPTEKRNKKFSVYWHCRCDCLQKEIQSNIPNTLHHVDGTCVEHLEKRKHRNDNTSGFRGVHRLNNGKYTVNIGFKGKQYYIGRFCSFSEAVAARLEAEKVIHEGFLQAYYIWERKAEDNPEWAKENPMVFEVHKVNGEFCVTTNVNEN